MSDATLIYVMMSYAMVNYAMVNYTMVNYTMVSDAVAGMDPSRSVRRG